MKEVILNTIETQIIIDALKFYKNNISADDIYALSKGEIKIINRLINMVRS